MSLTIKGPSVSQRVLLDKRGKLPMEVDALKKGRFDAAFNETKAAMQVLRHKVGKDATGRPQRSATS